MANLNVILDGKLESSGLVFTPDPQTRLVDTIYQNTSSCDKLISASIAFAAVAAGSATTEAFSDANTPPVTLKATIAVTAIATSAALETKQIVFVCKAGHYYQLVTTLVGIGTTAAIVGQTQEDALGLLT